jgi:hypothetical protein
MAISKEMLQELLKDYKSPEDLLGENGLLKQLQKGLVEAALGSELTEHLGNFREKVPVVYRVTSPALLRDLSNISTPLLESTEYTHILQFSMIY